MSKNKGHQKGGIPETVKDFAEISFKEYKADNKGYFESKKELRNDYFATLAYDLPEVIDWILSNGHVQKPEVQEIKNKCYAKLAGDEGRGPAFIAYLTKCIKNDLDIDNIELFPIILHEIIADILKYNEEHKDKPEEMVEKPDDLFALYELILKKRIKKAKKKGIPEDLIFDLLGIMPCKEAAEYSGFFRVRAIFDLLYAYAETQPVAFGTIIEFLFDENDYRYVIGYALQERRDKYKNFNEIQKKLFNDINEWIFPRLEELEKSDIKDILENYIGVRKRDVSQGKDSNRRYYISSLPISRYPRIGKVVEQIKNTDAEAEKYL